MVRGRKVTYAKLHAGCFVGGSAGDLGSTLPPMNKTLSLSMFTTAEGLFINANGVEAIIPWANVQVAKLGPEESDTENVKPIKLASKKDNAA